MRLMTYIGLVTLSFGCKPQATSSLAVSSYMPEVQGMIEMCEANVNNGVSRTATTLLAGYAMTTFKKNVCARANSRVGFGLNGAEASKNAPKHPVVLAMQFGDAKGDRVVSRSHEYLKEKLLKQPGLLVIDVSNLSPLEAEKRVAQYRAKHPAAFQNDVRIVAGGHGSYMYEYEDWGVEEPLDPMSEGPDSGEAYDQAWEEARNSGSSSMTSDAESDLPLDNQGGFENEIEPNSQLMPQETYEAKYRHFITAGSKEGVHRMVRTKSLVGAIMKGSGADAEFICNVQSCMSGAAANDIMRDETMNKQVKAVVTSARPEERAFGWGPSHDDLVMSTLVDQTRALEDPKFKTMLDDNEDGTIDLEEYQKYRTGSNAVAAGQLQPLIEQGCYDSSSCSAQPRARGEVVAKQSVQVPFSDYQVNVPRVVVSGMMPNPVAAIPGMPKVLPTATVHRELKVYSPKETVTTREGINASDVALWPSLPKAHQEAYDGKYKPTTLRDIDKQMKNQSGYQRLDVEHMSYDDKATPVYGDELPEEGEKTYIP